MAQLFLSEVADLLYCLTSGNIFDIHWITSEVLLGAQGWEVSCCLEEILVGVISMIQSEHCFPSRFNYTLDDLNIDGHIDSDVWHALSIMHIGIVDQVCRDPRLSIGVEVTANVVWPTEINGDT